MSFEYTVLLNETIDRKGRCKTITREETDLSKVANLVQIEDSKILEFPVSRRRISVHAINEHGDSIIYDTLLRFDELAGVLLSDELKEARLELIEELKKLGVTE